MELSGLTSRILTICNVIVKLVYLNILWLVFTVLGLGIFGVMPATISLYTVTRKWARDEWDVPVFPLFWRTYRKEFFRSLPLAGVLFLIGAFIFIDLVILPAEGVLNIFRVVLFVLGFLYLLILFYIFPIYVHYQMKTMQYIKYAFSLGISYPQYTLLMIVSAAILFIGLITFPSSIPLFAISGPGYIFMWIASRLFKRIDEKRLQLNESTSLS
ncbi:YesL family protein [Bacillus sinesaloumensis]|uniref:YesL family protein n=1 Tax=Litchfieldia sinesaloumensis TaxID=1926280 RepID=UPI00135632C7|nr:YesL family protein [Bacillus sinesaloumensis]